MVDGAGNCFPRVVRSAKFRGGGTLSIQTLMESLNTSFQRRSIMLWTIGNFDAPRMSPFDEGSLSMYNDAWCP